MNDFQKELENLINRHCLENESDTPDFILAQYLRECLTVFKNTVRNRDIWYGFRPWGSTLETPQEPGKDQRMGPEVPKQENAENSPVSGPEDSSESVVKPPSEIIYLASACKEKYLETNDWMDALQPLIDLVLDEFRRRRALGSEIEQKNELIQKLRAALEPGIPNSTAQKTVDTIHKLGFICVKKPDPEIMGEE